MKEGRRAGGLTAGPESKIMDGNWEDRVDGSDSRPFSAQGHAGDTIEYKVGAASKGIIQRDFQHHATVYKQAYAKNPFDNITNEELQEYQRIVDAKSRNGEKKKM
jgi:adducin